MNQLSVGVLAFNRPDTLWQCLRALKYALEHSPVKPHLVALIDRSPNNTVNKTVRMLIEDGPVVFNQILIPNNRLDCNKAEYALFHNCFSSSYNMCLIEDDIVVCNDFFKFVWPALEIYKNNKQVFSICGFSKKANKLDYEESIGILHKCVKLDTFCCYGMAWWRRSWEQVKNNWPTKDEESWDKSVLELVTREQQTSIIPSIARSINIGHYNGRYSGKNSRKFWEDHLAVRWSSDMFMPRNENWQWPI